MVYFY